MMSYKRQDGKYVEIKKAKTNGQPVNRIAGLERALAEKDKRIAELEALAKKD